MSSSPTSLPGSLRRTKCPERSPIPAVRPRDRYVFGHTLGWALLGSLEGTHQQYSNPGAPWIFQVIGFAMCPLYHPGNNYAPCPEDQAGENTARRCGFVEIKISMKTKTQDTKNLKISVLISTVLDAHLLCCCSWVEECRGWKGECCTPGVKANLTTHIVV